MDLLTLVCCQEQHARQTCTAKDFKSADHIFSDLPVCTIHPIINSLLKCLRHTVFYLMQTEINFVPHVSKIALQFIARHCWHDVSTSKVYWGNDIRLKQEQRLTWCYSLSCNGLHERLSFTYSSPSPLYLSPFPFLSLG